MLNWISKLIANRRAYKAEVAVEYIAICVETTAANRRVSPEKLYSVSVVEEASYMGVHCDKKTKRIILSRAIERVREMTKYTYQECLDGGRRASPDWRVIYANSPLEAAQKIAGPNVRIEGKLGELCIRLRGPKSEETCFYRDQNSH